MLAYRRTAADGGETRTVLVNFTEAPVRVPAARPDKTIVEVASDGAGEGLPYSGTLGPDQALILR